MTLPGRARQLLHLVVMDDALEVPGRDEPVDVARALLLAVFTAGLAVAFVALVVVDQVSASTF